MGNKSSRTQLLGKVKRKFGNQCCMCLQSLDGALGQGGAPGEGTPGQVTCLPCQHEFHTDCWKKWRKQKRACPTCRRQVPPSPQQQQNCYWGQQNSQQQQQNSQQQRRRQRRQDDQQFYQRRSRGIRYQQGQDDLWARIRNSLDQRRQAGEDPDYVALLEDQFDRILNGLGPDLVELLVQEAVSWAPAMVMVLNARISDAFGFRAFDERILIDPSHMSRQAVRRLAADLGNVDEAVRHNQRPLAITVPYDRALMYPEGRTALIMNGSQPDFTTSELPIGMPLGISAFVAAVLPRALDPSLYARQDLDQIARNGSQVAANEAREAREAREALAP
jgi:RING-H2 zinc finger domain